MVGHVACPVKGGSLARGCDSSEEVGSVAVAPVRIDSNTHDGVARRVLIAWPLVMKRSMSCCSRRLGARSMVTDDYGDEVLRVRETEGRS